MIYLGQLKHRETLCDTLCALRGCGRPAEVWLSFLYRGRPRAVALCHEHGDAAECGITRHRGTGPGWLPQSIPAAE